jgi:hypothetical protein
MPPRVTIQDVTLREGQQAAEVAFTMPEKVELAGRLAAARVRRLQAGYAGSDDETIITLKRELLGRHQALLDLLLAGVGDQHELGSDAHRPRRVHGDAMVVPEPGIGLEPHHRCDPGRFGRADQVLGPGPVVGGEHLVDVHPAEADECAELDHVRAAGEDTYAWASGPQVIQKGVLGHDATSVFLFALELRARSGM